MQLASSAGQHAGQHNRRAPLFTYGLIVLNTLIFLFTVFLSNINLPSDQVLGRQAIDELLRNDPIARELRQMLARPQDVVLRDETGQVRGVGADELKERIAQRLQRRALRLAYAKADTAQGYQRVAQIESVDQDIVLEPHYSALNIFAYRAAEPSFWSKLLGLFGSMFLHGSFDHLIGNMLFLWVFGRALEETLGPLIYLGSYLLAGVAATLLYHVITVQFTPQTAGLPLMGASGAIAGAMGLFATRFYRTPTILPAVIICGALGSFALTLVLHLLTGDGFLSALLGMMGAVTLLSYFGRDWNWKRVSVPAAWAIGAWLVLLNIRPGIELLFSTAKAGGTAYWAHIGGFGFGMLYALLIGSPAEGGREYLLADAQKAYDGGEFTVALERAQNLLRREPDNAAAHEVLALSHDRLGQTAAALDGYETAIAGYLGRHDRVAAARLYLQALRGHTSFMLQAPQQLAVGNQMAQNADWQHAAETLTKLPYTFPDAPEGEIALLRGAQIYLERLSQPQQAAPLLNLFVARYPDSQWMPQVQRAFGILREQSETP